LSAAYEFKDVFSMYGFNNRQFTWVPSHEDWDKVKSVCELLGVFNLVPRLYLVVTIQHQIYSFLKFGE